MPKDAGIIPAFCGTGRTAGCRMKAPADGMDTIEWIEWIVQCLPGGFVVGIVLTFMSAALFDFAIEWQSIGGLVLVFLPGLVAGLLIVMAISHFLGVLWRRLLRLIGFAR
jgi:hypothetical protein